ncbi:MAG: SH3 domain-containing protein [Clostridia bacterium]|nr:SH3 domain-containing protein [Clostridia bacterium]
MYSVNAALQNYPEWYRVEKDTGETIKKLSSVKELSFYLRNPDESVRRLAILRVNELKLRDSIDVLKEILEDHLESMSNKELAAWTIKAVSLKWGIDIFISHKLLSKFTGSEKYHDLFMVSVLEPQTSVHFDFSSSLILSELNFDSSNIRHSEDIIFDTGFNLRDWFHTWLGSFKAMFKEILIPLPSKAINLLKITILFIFNRTMKTPGYIWRFIKQPVPRSKTLKRKRISEVMIGNEEAGEPSPLPVTPCASAPNHTAGVTSPNVLSSLRPKESSWYKKNKYDIDLIRKFSQWILQVTVTLFYPVRLFIKHRVFSALILLSIYIFLTYTPTGKILTYKNFGLDLLDIQTAALESAEEIFSFTLAEIREISGIESKENQRRQDLVKDTTKPSQLKQYRVTAKTGLNLRKAPSDAAERATLNMLPAGTVVTYLSESQEDSKGRIWHRVQTKEQLSGWAYSKWLEEIGGAGANGQ